jgi:hypothetical protein
MNEHRFDRDVDPPDDEGSFLPRPEFFSTIYRLASHPDVAVRYYAAEQFVALMEASCPPSEAAVNAVELVNHILALGQVREGVEQFTTGFHFAVAVNEDWDQFGDDGATARLVFEIVSLPLVVDRAAALSSFVLYLVETDELLEPNRGHIRRFLLAARGDRIVRPIS